MNSYRYLGALAVLGCASVPVVASAQTTLKANAGDIHAELVVDKLGLITGTEIGLTLRLMNGVNPGAGDVSASLSMPSMAGMAMNDPVITPDRTPGEYHVAIKFPHPGKYRLVIRVKNQTIGFDLDVKSMMPGMDMDDMTMSSMEGMLGPWSMSREGSGTSWLPDDSPMFMKSLGKIGSYDLSYMGSFSLNFTNSNVNGGRGDSRFFSNSMPMLMARRETGGGILGLRVMGSLDPIFNGKYGYPDLFQTGETAYGKPLVDYQHPHDLLSEVSVTYSKGIHGETRGFLYLAPIGEPALGGSMFLMRPSGMENPEAPITHHWYDSSHITFGVITGGLTFGDKWMVEASTFKGAEPDEDRFTPDKLGLDSASGRLTYNPTRSLSLSTSYGYIHNPESVTEPGKNQHRLTAAASYSKGDFSATALFGRNVKQDGHTSDAILLEASLYRGDWSYYTRFENVDKDELVGVPAGSYKVNKLIVGATKDFAHSGGFDLGVGGYFGVYSIPESLKPFYGSSPLTLGVYLRIRPSRMAMNHEMEMAPMMISGR